jgi:uncharacterized protein YbjT (DUF2867 family)
LLAAEQEARFQPVAAAEVARAVADVAEQEPRGTRVQVAGPQVMSAADLARTCLATTSRRAARVPVPVPGKIGRALRTGALTAEDADVLGVQTFAAWLAARAAARQRQTTASRP